MSRITAGGRSCQAPGLSRSAGTSASQCGSAKAASSWAMAPRYRDTRVAGYSCDRCTHSTAWRWKAARCGAGRVAGASGAVAGAVAQPARASDSARAAAVSRRPGSGCRSISGSGCGRAIECTGADRVPASSASVVEQRLDRGEAGAGALLLALRVRHRVGAIALQLVRRKLIEEPARLQSQPAPPARCLARIRQPQPLLGPGDAHVEQAPLFVQTALVDA